MSDFYSAQTMSTMIYEIFGHANKLLKQDRKRGIEFITTNRSRVVIEGLLKMTYDPSIVFHLPPGEAPFKKQLDVPDGYCLTDLKQEFRRLRIFTDGSMNITRTRREQLWLQMCEGLFWKEADLIHKVKDRRITDLYDEFTVETVREMFPGLLPEIVAEPVPVEETLPVDYGPDPSLISEKELIEAAVQQMIMEELGQKTEEPKAPEKEDTVDIGNFKESKEYQEFLEFKKFQEQQAKKAQAAVMGETSANTQPPQRKKPGPKPKPKTDPVEPKVRKKPGPKPRGTTS